MCTINSTFHLLYHKKCNLLSDSFSLPIQFLLLSAKKNYFNHCIRTALKLQIRRDICYLPKDKISRRISIRYNQITQIGKISMEYSTFELCGTIDKLYFCLDRQQRHLANSYRVCITTAAGIFSEILSLGIEYIFANFMCFKSQERYNMLVLFCPLNTM